MKKLITTKAEKELKEMVYFQGKYVDSLIKKAKAYYTGETVKELLRDAKRKKFQQEKIQAKRYGLSVKRYGMLKAKAERILSDFSTGHSMGCYRTFYLTYKGNRLQFATNNNLDTYANSCKWRANYGSLSIEMAAKELQQIEKVEGIWTIAKNDGSACWLVETGAKQYYEINWQNGFLAGTTHGATLEEAQNGEALKMQKIIAQIKNNARFVGIQHIKKTGACNAGINAFCRKYGLNKEHGYNLGFLKSLENSIYFEKVQEI